MISRSNLHKTLLPRRLSTDATSLPSGVFYIAGTDNRPSAGPGDLVSVYHAGGQYPQKTLGPMDPLGPEDVYHSLRDASHLVDMRWSYGTAFTSSDAKITPISDQLGPDIDRDVIPLRRMPINSSVDSSHLNDVVKSELKKLGVEQWFVIQESTTPPNPVDYSPSLERFSLRLDHIALSPMDPNSARAQTLETGSDPLSGALLTDGARNAAYPILARLIVDAYAPLVRVVFPASGGVMYAPASMLFDVSILPTNEVRQISPTSPNQPIVTVEFSKNDDWAGVLVTHLFQPNITEADLVNVYIPHSLSGHSIGAIRPTIQSATWLPVQKVGEPNFLVPLTMSGNKEGRTLSDWSLQTIL